ncbi:ABC-type transporter, integral membrane subunit [Spirochaeta thermophila DSM 6578]|uniref:ABC-type transporter, integral membrane subunit n=1 Tax=Winmispira thermophila (strain ATCC 700085 / DSM 6578 / Z-1203) TaxID=869211 RepID=G0GE22_WINT7|nr:carbohydrate ABC transporter permease [Spirochaeta thermophila]AEJ60654.1 ABC-type transporter, integral membrane subunit [Spirochaeta thermophila DSM 6578]
MQSVMVRERYRRAKRGDALFNAFNYTAMILLGIATLYPFLNVLAISLNDSVDTVRGGITIFPRKFTLENYAYLFSYPSVVRGAVMSVLRTAVGTVTGLVSTAMVAYAISRRDFFARRFVTGIFVMTMYISAGLIPDYMLIRSLGLINNFLVYILPGLISAFNVIVLRSYIEGLPYELQESAKIDGANDFVIFSRVVMPLCLPVLATIALFIAVGHWNSWFDTYLYASSNKYLTTLQFELQKILTNVQSQAAASAQDIYSYALTEQTRRVSPESIRMAMTIVATVPILCVYPFLQKYFTRGLVLGALKQ